MKNLTLLPFLMVFPGVILSGSTSQDELILAELQALNENVKRLEQQIVQLQDQLVSVTAEAVQAGTNPAADDSGSLVQRVAEAIHIKEDKVNFPWMAAGLWTQIEEGMSESEIMAVLGEPTLNEPSLHKRVDTVFTYRGRRASTGEKVVGKVKFFKGKTVEIEAP